jgi:hypothetical protein
VRKLFVALAIIVICTFVLLTIRFSLGGDEDTWICKNRHWIKHGNPSTQMPQVGCNED